MRQVFLDTETTGLNAQDGDRIVEIGCIELVNRRPTEHDFHHYLNPGRASHPDALRVHGLTDEFLADKPRFADVAQALLAYVEGAELVIHNAGFDVGFLDEELGRVGLGPLAKHVARITDSLALARERWPGKSNSLDALCKRLEVDATHRVRHGALLDAGLLAEVYLRMTRGQDSFAIDLGGESAAAGADTGSLAAGGLDGLALIAVEPSAPELEAHAQLVAELDAGSRSGSIWSRLASRPSAGPHA
jgi:DNA polymerase-3 subunit epsilon